MWFIYDLDDSHITVSEEQEVIKTLQSLSVSQKQDKLDKQVLLQFLTNSNAPNIGEYGYGKGTEFKLTLTSEKQIVNTFQIFQMVFRFAYVWRALQVGRFFLFFSNNNQRNSTQNTFAIKYFTTAKENC